MILDIEHISLDISLDVLGPVRIFQGVVRILIVAARWSNIRNHYCPAVSSQGIFEKTSQLWVSERDVVGLTFWVILVKHVDAVTQG